MPHPIYFRFGNIFIVVVWKYATMDPHAVTDIADVREMFALHNFALGKN